MKIAILLGLFAASSACLGPTLPDEEPFLRGKVIAVGSQIELGSPDDRDVWIKRDELETCGYIVYVPRGADIGRRLSRKMLWPADFDELRSGQSVSLWITGNIADSCPGQTTARAIEITDPGFRVNSEPDG